MRCAAGTAEGGCPTRGEDGPLVTTTPAQERLRKVLELERSKGCNDRAVTAGLDSFLKNLIAHDPAELSDGVYATIRSLPVAGYRSLTPERRQRWLEGLLAAIRGEAPARAASSDRSAGTQPAPKHSSSDRSAGTQPALKRPGFDRSAGLQPAPRVPAAALAPSAGVQPAPDSASTRETGAVRRQGRAAGQPAAREPKRPLASERSAPVHLRPYTQEELQALGTQVELHALKRVGFALKVKFEKLGIHTVDELLHYFPRRHVDYGRPVPVSQLEIGREQTVRVRVWSARERPMGFRMRSTEATVGDSSGMMTAVWFNQPWIAKQLPVNAEVVLSGRVSEYKGRPKFDNPEWEIWSDDLLHTGRLVPIYPLTAGLQNRTVRRVMQEAIERFAHRLPEPLPQELRERLDLAPIAEAVAQMHYPTDSAALDRARRRLAFEELLPIQLAVQIRRRHFQRSAPAQPLPLSAEAERGFREALPFTLTGAQEKALFDVLNDMRRPVPMSRLVEGDVGSGKTVIAAAALLAAVENGAQGVMMAPTEILAEQHFRTLCALFGAGTEAVAGAVAEVRLPYIRRDDRGWRVDDRGRMLPSSIFHPPSSEPSDGGRTIRIALLTGSLKQRERRILYDALEAGEIDIACGTHALIQSGVRFNDLGVAVVDEQHRFGVMQRAALREKGARGPHTPHMLVMTATPIPRTLALTVYGDLDISVIDELPPGRQPVKTTWVGPDEREDAERFVRAQVEQGRQAFIICPLVEESESLSVKSAVAEYERLRQRVFPDLRLELLHGRMGAKAKDEAMRRFRDGQADILVSTAVVEVGVDVPNATVMLIEGADRFGLAQLHQFRGRVGRGAEQSYCLLLSDEPSEEARQRLELMERTTDGFRLAEADLEMRGPGQFFGTRQSGVAGLKVAKLTDTKLIELTRAEAERMLEEDPGLTRIEHRALNVTVRGMLDDVVDEEH